MPAALGPYVFERRLGVGGMGEVHLARHRLLERQVAIKHIRLDMDVDLHGRKRLRREARAAARLSHPAVVQIHDLLESEDGDWIVMELIDGPTLGQVLSQGPLDVGRALDLGRQVAEGLAASHEQGVLHRDLKSDNIMLEGTRKEGPWRARILDFGLAKVLWWHDDTQSSSFAHSLTAHGEVMGTCRAMSPEQAKGLELDGRSDLFSLGSLLYEMLTAVAPFQAETPVLTMTRVASHEPPPPHNLRPSVPREVSGLLAVLMQKSPDDRPANGWQVARELERLIRSLDLDRTTGPVPSAHLAGSREVTPTVLDPLAVRGPDSHRGAPGDGPAKKPASAPGWQPHVGPRPLVPAATARSRVRNPWIVAPILALAWGLLGFAAGRILPGASPEPRAAGIEESPPVEDSSARRGGAEPRAEVEDRDRAVDPMAEASHLRVAARALWSRGQKKAARANLAVAADLLRRQGSDRQLAHVLADLAADRQEAVEAEAFLDEARRFAERGGHVPTRVRIGARSAEQARRRGQLALARRHALAVLDMVPDTLRAPGQPRAEPIRTGGPDGAPSAEAADIVLADIVLAYLVLAHCDHQDHGPSASGQWLKQALRRLGERDGEDDEGSTVGSEPWPEAEWNARARLARLFEESERPWDGADLLRDLSPAATPPDS